MILESIRLVNIKSFEDETLQFARGINIIAGRNGAGKSTIVEAVGVALFDAWPVKFKDGNARTGFIRRGQGEGSIELTLSDDGKRFTILCNLGERRRKGKDPTTDYERILYSGDGQQLSASAGRKAEFQEDIRQHILGVSRIGDDKLYENIIGTAQGAFDEPFTAPESERRQLFEKILGVEDFQRYEKQFARFVKYLNERVTRLKDKAEVLESAGKDLDAAKEELKERTAQAEALGKTHAAAVTKREEAQKQYEAEKAKREALAQLRDTVARQREHHASVLESLAHHRKELEAAQKAEEIRTENEAAYNQYKAADIELDGLKFKREEREQEQKKYDQRLREHEATAATSNTKLEGLNERGDVLQKEVEALLKERDVLTAKRDTLRDEWKQAKAALDRVREEEAFVQRVESYVTELVGVQKALMDSNGAIRNLRDELAALETDAEALLNKKPEVFTRSTIQAVRSETAELFASVITELDQHIEPRDMETLIGDVKTVLASVRDAVRKAEEHQSDIKSKGEVVKQEIDASEKTEKKLRGEQQYVVNEKEKIAAIVANEDIGWKQFEEDHTKTMKAFDTLDESIAACEKLKKENRAAYERFMEVVSDAAKLDERTKAATEAAAQEEKLRTDLETNTKALAAQEKAYSEEQYTALTTAYEEAKAHEQQAATDAASARTRMEEQQRRVNDAEKSYAKYTEFTAQAERASAEHGFFETVMKEVVRGLAQRVGARIVSSVSDYADQLYARIAPEQTASLVWDPMTYGIELHAPQGIVKGKELSGGQLMGVSLAIKLALIKWYSQSHIGFLDEPTTHLDKETRRHLSEVIMNLETIASEGAWFDQLFVISHEEALHGAGHRIELARTEGVSAVAGVD